MSDLLAAARAAMGISPAESVDKPIEPAGQHFTADFFCEFRFPEGHRRAGEHHGRFARMILKENRGKSFPCPVCGEFAPEVPGAPRVMNASRPDGVRPKGFEDQLKASDLEVAAIDLDPFSSERQEIETEIYERTKIED